MLARSPQSQARHGVGLRRCARIPAGSGQARLPQTLAGVGSPSGAKADRGSLGANARPPWCGRRCRRRGAKAGPACGPGSSPTRSCWARCLAGSARLVPLPHSRSQGVATWPPRPRTRRRNWGCGLVRRRSWRSGGPHRLQAPRAELRCSAGAIAAERGRQRWAPSLPCCGRRAEVGQRRARGCGGSVGALRSPPRQRCNVSAWYAPCIVADRRGTRRCERGRRTRRCR